MFGSSPLGSGPFGKTSSYGTIHATTVQTLGPATVVGVAVLGLIADFANLEITLQPITSVASALTPNGCSVAQTLQAVTSTASGTSVVNATTSQVLQPATLSSILWVGIVANLTATLGAVTASVTAGPVVKATVAATLDAISLTSTSFLATICFVDSILGVSALYGYAYRRLRRIATMVRTLRPS